MDINKIEPPKIIKVEVTISHIDVNRLRSEYSRLGMVLPRESGESIYELIDGVLKAAREVPRN